MDVNIHIICAELCLGTIFFFFLVYIVIYRSHLQFLVAIVEDNVLDHAKGRCMKALPS